MFKLFTVMALAILLCACGGSSSAGGSNAGSGTGSSSGSSSSGGTSVSANIASVLPSTPMAAQAVSFAANGSGTGTLAYSWSFGDGSSGTGALVSHGFATAGTYHVTLTVTDSTSATASASTTVVVSAVPVSATVSSVSPANPLNGQTTTFTGTGTGQGTLTYTWNFGDGSSASGATATHAFAAAGYYTVVLTVQDQAGNSASATMSVAVSHPVPVATITSVSSNPVAGQVLAFSGAGSGGTTPYTYAWNFGDGSSGTGAAPTHSYAASGSFTVSLVVTDSSSTASSASTATLTVIDPPAPSALAIGPSPMTATVNTAFNFTGTASGASPLTYSWNFGDGSSAATGAAVSHAYATVGSYTVTLTVTDPYHQPASSTATFSVTAAPPPPPSESVIYTLGTASNDGTHAYSALVQGTDGNFYGTTNTGGSHNQGTVLKITPAGVATILYSFGASSTDGATPEASLILGTDGNFYGTTLNGGANDVASGGDGTVFRITPSGVETVLYSFGASATDSSRPESALVQGVDGNFYGTTVNGGTSNDGTVFKVTPTGVETVLHSFVGGTDGIYPQASLIQGSDGSFYGTTSNGGVSGFGTVFSITSSGAETILHAFSGASTDGSYPYAPLVQGSDGNLYGTTVDGGASNYGTVYQITPAGIERVLYSFAGGTADGYQPYAALVPGTDGTFYGTTVNGGTYGDGTIFKVTATGVETILHAFAGGNTDGATPRSPLTLGTDGNFYGMTTVGGHYNDGVVFKLVP